ncbi:two component transcriptional regulator, LuxR family [Duganella sp. CF517]|uniref:response regulator transcription factor n=1 Tax=Duganella sp. CF517 TaxID=1881038 RepID=UPI0008C7140B|nr:response regulator transcription factor [Duganella sp. CF517]SEN50041.1 two component transcriptional regulator, LuxR family [Duganella sp. CF517]
MSTSPIRLMLVDDHPIFLDGMVRMVNSHQDFDIVATALSAASAIAQFSTFQPDVTLMDIGLADMDGIEALLAIRASAPRARVLILTTFFGDLLVRRAMQAGAAGYLLKSSLRQDIADAIRLVHAGGCCVPPDIAASLNANPGPTLSQREVDVLKLVALGFSNKHIALRLFIKEDTAKVHVKNIMEKLAAANRTHAVTLALKRGILASE